MKDGTYSVYVMSNKLRTVFYIGITNDLTRRVSEHRSRSIEGFTKRYRCDRLLYWEDYEDPDDAIAREKQLKGWTRKKKEALVAGKNPRFSDLAASVLGLDSR